MVICMIILTLDQALGNTEFDSIPKEKGKTRMRVYMALLAALMVSACSNPDIPGKKYMVDGAEMHLYCTGTRNEMPTVIIEAGLGGPTGFYRRIQDGLSPHLRVCSYDRAGIGWSDTRDTPRDAAHMVSELHRLLAVANEPGPYILTGHSLAGLIMRVYIGQYPDEVVGVAFLDPSHPDQFSRIPDMDDFLEKGKTLYKYAEYAATFGLTHIYNPITAGDWWDYVPEEVQPQLTYLFNRSATYVICRKELKEFMASATEAKAAGNLGGRPTVVVTAGTFPDLENSAMESEYRKITSELHKEIAALSTKGQQVGIAKADHMSLIVNPEYANRVVDLILEVSHEAKADMDMKN